MVKKLSKINNVSVINFISSLFTFYKNRTMLIGYARVSTHEQSLDLQKDALTQAGCEQTYEDKVSGVVAARPGLEQVKQILRKGDTLVVWRLDRLGRSLRDLMEWMNYLEKKQVGLRSLQESIDTTTTTGKLVFHIFGALAEFERNLIRERTQAGLAAARARGRLGGRPKSLDENKRKVVVDLYNKKELMVKEICEMMEISKPTLYSYIRESQNSNKNPAVK